ncbi:hypothetical protein L336_0210 [Candidatus Saccharimonas aalborgensis]|uniref:Uncharacterized protein n=2 Tax=Candidatus Saccharimonas aalborgensis TaxID=1332188 RepID=R4PM31_9BACT|nr:hypothetical protein L336_0210 [Candidatus Saccharimonas aalborgensis]QQR51719.1 MAG: hypothetical protein IPF89_02805 [Candidatus Saccharibacteria bacterium]
MNGTEFSPPKHDSTNNLVPDGFVPGPTHESLMAATLAEQDRTIAEAIAEAIAANPNKESFDYVRFAQLYSKKDTTRDLTGDEPLSVQEAYRREYYLVFSDAQTIEEYVRHRHALDAESGN